MGDDRPCGRPDRGGVGNGRGQSRAGGSRQRQGLIARAHLQAGLKRSSGSIRPPASISGNDDDGDDNECRDQRKRAIECSRSGLRDIVERRHGLCWRPQFADEPANVSRLHWIRRYGDLFDMIAFRAVERAKFKSCRSRRNARKHHAHLAFRAAQSLNCKQWDCGYVIGHAFHL
jgi:hypothetical protein